MKKAVAILLCFIICISMIPLASAANVCYQITGYSDAERVFTVETLNRPILSETITLTQSSKGKVSYRPAIGIGTKTKSAYMAYTVYYKRSGDKAWKTKKWTGKSCTLSLKKYSTYTVKVVPYSSTQLNKHFSGSRTKFERILTWSVSKTKGINLCS